MWLLMIVLVATCLASDDKHEERSKVAATKNEIQTSICDYTSKVVICCDLKDWFRLNRVGRSVENMTLENNQLTELRLIDMKRFKHLKYLDVSHNGINSVKRSFVRNKNLYELVADDNQLGINLRSYEGALKRAFKNNHKLTRVFLRRNGIKMLSSIMLNKWNNSLEILNVAENEISKISRRTMACMSHLKELDLHTNKISKLHKKAFAKNSKLRKLDLHQNYISFSNKRQRLDLTSNKLLTHLYLSENELLSLSHIDLSGNILLEEFDASMNRFKSLSEDDFKYNRNLANLNLSHNFIKSIERDAFRYLAKLKILDLENNRLEFLNSSVFSSLKSLQMLNLQRNYFVTWQPLELSGLIQVRAMELDNEDDITLSLYDRTMKWLPRTFEAKERRDNDYSSSNELQNGERTRIIFANLECLKLSGNPFIQNAIEDKRRYGVLRGLRRKPCLIKTNIDYKSYTCGCDYNQSESSTMY